MKPNRTDAVIDEIREVRQKISQRFAHDPTRLVAYYMELQEQYRERLLGQEQSPKQHEDRSAA